MPGLLKSKWSLRLRYEFALPLEDHQIVKVLSDRENKVREVEDPDGLIFWVSIPRKFRENVWDLITEFILVEPIAEGDKVKAEMVRPLTKDEILLVEGLWLEKLKDDTGSAISKIAAPDESSLPTENFQIVKVLSSKGNKLHEVETLEGSTSLVSIPTKFRKNVPKEGYFILVKLVQEVKAKMVGSLTKRHAWHYNKAGVWPERFQDSVPVYEYYFFNEDISYWIEQQTLDHDSEDSSESDSET